MKIIVLPGQKEDQETLVEEQEHYCKDMDEMIVNTLWRNGEFWIQVCNSEEQEYLQSYVGEQGVENYRLDQEPFLPHFFQEWEIYSERFTALKWQVSGEVSRK